MNILIVADVFGQHNNGTTIAAERFMRAMEERGHSVRVAAHCEGREDCIQLPRRRIPYLRRKMGVVFQDFRLFDNKTAYENIAFALRVTGEGKKLIQKRVPYFLNIVGLRDKAASYPTELSGGEW